MYGTTNWYKTSLLKLTDCGCVEQAGVKSVLEKQFQWIRKEITISLLHTFFKNIFLDLNLTAMRLDSLTA